MKNTNDTTISILVDHIKYNSKAVQHIPRQSTALDKDADQFSWYAAGNCIFQIQEAGSS